MLKGFEDYTGDLTDYEKSLLPLFVKSMKLRRGEKMAIKGAQIVADLQARDAVDGTKRFEKLTVHRAKRILSYMRVNDMVPGLMANQKGYFVTTTLEELEVYIDSLTGRINAINLLLNTARNNYIGMGGDPAYGQCVDIGHSDIFSSLS